MARVKMTDICEHLSMPIRAALDDAVEHTLPGVEVDRAKLFREFRRAVGARCKTWENVPNTAVDAD
jgi:hypothetical protein